MKGTKGVSIPLILFAIGSILFVIGIFVMLAGGGGWLQIIGGFLIGFAVVYWFIKMEESTVAKKLYMIGYAIGIGAILVGCVMSYIVNDYNTGSTLMMFGTSILVSLVCYYLIDRLDIDSIGSLVAHIMCILGVSLIGAGWVAGWVAPYIKKDWELSQTIQTAGLFVMVGIGIMVILLVYCFIAWFNGDLVLESPESLYKSRYKTTWTRYKTTWIREDRIAWKDPYHGGLVCPYCGWRSSNFATQCENPMCGRHLQRP